MTNPCIWKGTVYPSQAAAAKAIGVSQAIVSYHLEKHGHLDMAGERKMRAGKPKRPGFHQRDVPPSPYSISPATGVDIVSVARWIQTGDVDKLIAATCLFTAATNEGRNLMASLKDIAAIVAQEHGITLADIMSEETHRVVARARQDAMLRQREITGFSYPRIAKFWGKDHTTVLYAVRVAKARAGMEE